MMRLLGRLGIRILDRYVSTEFLRIFGVCVLGVPFIFIVIDLVDSLDTYLAEGATRMDIVWHYVYQFPYQSLLAFPIACLLAAVFTISRMTRRFEVTAAKAGGVSFYRLCAPLLVLGFGISFVALGLTDVVPRTNKLAADVLTPEELRGRNYRRDFVFRSEEGRVYRVGQLDVLRERMRDVRVEREGTGGAYPTYSVIADSAAWDSAAGRWTLFTGRMRLFPEPEHTLSFRFRELRQRPFTERPRELLADPKDPDEMTYAELGRYVRAIERSGGNAANLAVQRALRIAYPFTCFIIVGFGLPLANSTRRGGAPFAVGVALAITIFFLMIIRLAEALGAGGVLPPWTAAWLPNSLFLVAGAILFVRVRT